MIGVGRPRLGLGGVAILALALLGAVCSASPTRDLKARWYFPEEIDVLSVTVQELQQFLSNGTVTSVQLTQRYLVSDSTLPIHFPPERGSYTIIAAPLAVADAAAVIGQHRQQQSCRVVPLRCY
jgi:hypothetical protein